MQGGKEARSEAYSVVRCNDERRGQRRRWAFFNSLLKLDRRRGGWYFAIHPLVYRRDVSHMMYRRVALGPALVAILLGCASCASRGSVRALQEGTTTLKAEAGSLKTETTSLATEITSLQKNVSELRQGQEQLKTDLTKLVRELQAVEDRIGTAFREQGSLGQHVATMEVRIREMETALREMREAMTQLSTQVSKLMSPPHPVGAQTEQLPASPASPEELYNSAVGHYRKGEFGQAILELDELVMKFLTHPLAMEAQYWIGEAYYSQKDYRQALVEFQKVVDRHSEGNRVPDALLKIGLSHRALRNPARAVEVWQRLVRDYPASDAAREARTALGGRAPTAPPKQGR